ncbi:MAG: hypothetical protein INR69_15195 [Mucilaginibacter polytrichastri]|nr:hypothetical protein [Mucilaginibacter polytrichastri]
MENSDNTYSSDEHNEGVYFSEPIVEAIMRSAKWARFISIIGFLFAVLIAVFAFSINTFMPQLGQMASQTGADAGALASSITVTYLIMALVTAAFSYLLYQYASSAQAAVYDNDQAEMERSFTRLSSFFRFWGIITLIMAAMFIFSILSTLLLARSM